MVKLLCMNEVYDNNVQHYKTRDGILAIVLFGIMVLLYSILALMEIKIDFIKDNILVIGCVFNILMFGITVLFVKLNKEKLDTIGLYNGKRKNSCIIGMTLAGILLFNNCISHLLFDDGELLSLKRILELAVYYFLVSVSEEVVFRGYIGTRIIGLVKKKWIAIIVTGVLFVIMHFPYRIIAYEMTLVDLTINNLGWILDLFVTHIVLSIIYFKTNSLYGSIISHWFSNLAYNLILR